jgi:hypothetical protein
MDGPDPDTWRRLPPRALAEAGRSSSPDPKPGEDFSSPVKYRGAIAGLNPEGQRAVVLHPRLDRFIARIAMRVLTPRSDLIRRAVPVASLQAHIPAAAA